MNKITKKYSKEQLTSYGIWIEYMVSPYTFNPYLIFFSKHDIEWKLEKEFDKMGDSQEIEDYIDEVVDKLIILNRNKKIIKIINK